MSVLPSLPVKLPANPISDDIDAEKVAFDFAKRVAALSVNDLVSDAVWRDLYAFTGTLRTFYGATNIIPIWSKLTAKRNVEHVHLEPGSAQIIRMESNTWLDARYKFQAQTPSIKGTFYLSLVPGGDGEWRVWVARTILESIDGYADVDVFEPVMKRTTTIGSAESGSVAANRHFDCVVVGAGQAGLGVGGRLKALGVSYVILEKNNAIGDNWKNRYEVAKLHHARATAYLPFDRTFPSADYAYYLTKNELSRGFADWVQKFDINVWVGTSLRKGSWLPEKSVWKLEITRGSQAEFITSKHVVMATGAGGQIAKMPNYPGENVHSTIVHSSKFSSAKDFSGKPGIVVGTGNTAHDIAEDMVNSGCSSVTMVQRSPTYVLATEHLSSIQDLTYNDQASTTLADCLNLSNPFAVNRLTMNLALHARTRADPEPYDGLERAGFKLVRYGDITHQVFERFGGYYMDHGAVDKINRGLIKIKSDALPDQYTRRGLHFSDGTEQDADLIVFATGFDGNTRNLVRSLFGNEVGDQIDDFWGLNSEGELKGNFKPLSHPGLWMVGGSFAQARYLSRFVALSIRTSIDGKPLDVYRD